MNRFIGVGSLPRPGVLNGAEYKVLRFTLATLIGHNQKTNKGRWAYVPCVVFKPTERTVQLLTVDPKGILIGLEGRVNTSRFDSHGQTKYSTEVIVDERSIRVLQVHVGPEQGQTAETGKT